jgi:cellulose synthase/poly-beta-1,6-N-acetylglucosamine synthase-like glycosyltransferase
MNTDKILSVVIPVYNERATILKIIEKVCALDFGKNLQSQTMAHL